MTKKLLLADDSITIQKVIGIIFATEDYQLIICDDGDEAFAKALEEFPDLVIADIAMPGKDGFELCEAIKAEASLAHTSVLLLPGTFEHFDESRAEAVGADGWLSKPFESQALLDKVSQLLEAASVPLSFAGEPAAEEIVDEFVAEEIATVEEPTEDVVDLQDDVVDETILGLDDVEELEPLAIDDSVADDSADDIWDAVSFEEDELLQPEEDSAAVALDEIVEGAEPAEETIPAPVIEDEPVETEVPFAMDAAEEESDFSFTDDDAPLELTEEVATESELEEIPDFAAEEELPQEEEVESFVAEESDPVAMESIAAVAEVEVPSFETEDVEQSEFTATEEDEELPVVEPLSDEMLDDDEEILDLEEDDILEDEVVDESPVEEFVAPEPAVDEEDLESEEEIFILEEDDVATEDGMLTNIDDEPIEELVPEEIVADESIEEEFVIEPDEEEVVDELEVEIAPEIEPASDYAEVDSVDEDGSEMAEDDSLLQPAAALAAGFAAAAVETTQVEQIEQQLRELTEEELTEVVARVAGPTIEKLANEMLEQVVWEVVPDLAESMIREEIRKIRQGAE